MSILFWEKIKELLDAITGNEKWEENNFQMVFGNKTPFEFLQVISKLYREMGEQKSKYCLGLDKAK